MRKRRERLHSVPGRVHVQSVYSDERRLFGDAVSYDGATAAAADAATNASARAWSACL